MTENEAVAPTILPFIPIGRVIADPVEIGSAISMALYNRPSADATIWQGPEGEMVIEVFNPRTNARECFRPGDDHGPAQEYAMVLVHGGAVITGAMREGVIEAFVIDAAGRYLRIPRLYWLQANPTSETALIQTGHVPQELVGCPVLVDPSHISKWQEIAQPQVEQMLSLVRDQRGEKAVWDEDDASKPGPKPYKDYQMLAAIFKLHHDALSDCGSDNARHRYLTGKWSGIAAKVGREKCPSRGVVKRCWERYVATRR